VSTGSTTFDLTHAERVLDSEPSAVAFEHLTGPEVRGVSDHFCTYFDHRYAPKGLAMWRSLKACRPSAVLHVLCLNDACREMLDTLRLQDMHLYSLDALEADEPDLLQARANRSLLEYYFTLTPYLPLYIFRTHSEISRLTYLDADLFFFADPQPILDEVGDRSIAAVEHRFPERLADLEIYGRFNVGWLTFTNDSTALACLDTWRRQCVDWCFDHVEPGRYGEQKYLDDWPNRFPGLHVIQHRGANVAPWNLDRAEISQDGDEVRVGDQRLLFFHAHGFQPASPGQPHALNLEPYGVEATPLLTRTLFEPYEKALLSATAEIATPLALALLSERPRDSFLMLDSLRSVVKGLRARLESSEADRTARLDAIHALQGQLQASDTERAAALDLNHSLRSQFEASEVDRAARLDLIHALQSELHASDADGAARLDLIHSLQSQLQESEADRAARLDLIRSLQSQLQESEADRAARLDLIHRLQSQLQESEADRAARLDLIHSLQSQLQESDADRAARLDLIHGLQSQLQESEADRAVSRALNSRLQAELDRSHADVETLHQQLANSCSRLEALESTRSWRWTRPFRWVAGLTAGSAEDA